MTTQSTLEGLDARPFWQVQVVFDCEGGGSDFAYTIGLATRGLPELHMYARPSLGEDPGHDWKFSTADSVSILNELGFLLVRGELTVGSELTREYDGGLARVDFRVDPPGDREELEAYGVASGCDVLPVRWSLHRAPEGPPTTLNDADLETARKKFADLVAPIDSQKVHPTGWAPPNEPCFDPDQRFGPLTPLVLARTAQIRQAGAAPLARFAELCAQVQHWASLTWPATRAAAIARPVGRTSALARLSDELDGVMPWHAHDVVTRHIWREVVDSCWDPELARETGTTRRRFDETLRRLVRDGARSCLTVQAVADVADPELTLMGFGPWQAAMSGAGLPGTGLRVAGLPGEEWYASAEVLAVVRGLLSEIEPDQLLVLAAQHQLELSAGFMVGQRTAQYVDLVERLGTYALVSAAACPPVTDLVRGSRRRSHLAALLVDDSCTELFDQLSVWLTCLTSALVHRAKLSADDVRTFAAPVRSVLPGLEQALHTPL